MTHTAEFLDSYAGWIAIRLDGFTTTRKGQRVRRFRWVQTNGAGIGTFAAPFCSEASAISAAARYPAIFRNIA